MELRRSDCPVPFQVMWMSWVSQQSHLKLMVVVPGSVGGSVWLVCTALRLWGASACSPSPSPEALTELLSVSWFGGFQRSCVWGGEACAGCPLHACAVCLEKEAVDPEGPSGWPRAAVPGPVPRAAAGASPRATRSRVRQQHSVLLSGTVDRMCH